MTQFIYFILLKLQILNKDKIIFFIFFSTAIDKQDQILGHGIIQPGCR